MLMVRVAALFLVRVILSRDITFYLARLLLLLCAVLGRDAYLVSSLILRRVESDLTELNG